MRARYLRMKIGGRRWRFRDLADPLEPLRLAARMLYLVAEVAKHGEFGDDTEELVEAIHIARRMVLNAAQVLRSRLRTPGGAA
jgi:hypothetical protein